MLALNRTRTDQIIYDSVGSALTVGPATAAWVESVPTGFTPLHSVLNLTPCERLRLRRRGELGDLLYLSPSLHELHQAGVSNLDLEVAPNYLGLFAEDWIRTHIASSLPVNVDLTGSAEAWERCHGRKVRSTVFADILGVPLRTSRPVLTNVPTPSSPGPIVIQARAAHDYRSLHFHSMFRMVTAAAAMFRTPGVEPDVTIVDAHRLPEWDSPMWQNDTGQLHIPDLITAVKRAPLVVGFESGLALLGEALERPTLMLVWAHEPNTIVGEDWKWTRTLVVEQMNPDFKAILDAMVDTIIEKTLTA